jgi:hypothetical protein
MQLNQDELKALAGRTESVVENPEEKAFNFRINVP